MRGPNGLALLLIVLLLRLSIFFTACTDKQESGSVVVSKMVLITFVFLRASML